jgi:hypothetical protein
MNLSSITAELAYDLLQKGVWTSDEYQVWNIFNLKEQMNKIDSTVRHFMYGIRYQEGDYSRLTRLVFFNMDEAQDRIDKWNHLLIKENMPGRHVLETLILIDPENE